LKRQFILLPQVLLLNNLVVYLVCNILSYAIIARKRTMLDSFTSRSGEGTLLSLSTGNGTCVSTFGTNSVCECMLF
jgi:hypothetical protein